jgi:H+/Cl- antiporter ClcA
MDAGSPAALMILISVVVVTLVPAIGLGMLVGYGFARLVGKREEGDNIATAAASGLLGAAVGTPVAAVTALILWMMFLCFGLAVLEMADLLPDM